MKAIIFSLLIGLSFVINHAFAQAPLPQQPAPDFFIASDTIEINGQTYRKKITSPRSRDVNKLTLNSGDQVIKHALSRVSTATGLVFVTVNNPVDARSVANALKLELVYAHGESAVFSAAEEQNLLTLHDQLLADSRIKAAKVELNSSKFGVQ
ncbi:hypothetical protein [Vibrio sagamiensis]|uniref:ASP external chaperone domain-containing protein n=1 Tax=Vibrio sagamiensis NBRC 104589 TaxID=1219064 RepID=A0A511QCH4_9VIBR|nr:hypothetical protein [Vibrio sagamiensis]PNQ67397.1 hypothetical protein C1141_08115 [Vibrio agarivorans]GEM75003.1 hypothetical protein VSA01S_11150 [Vibrio sagamiensis NBRC 104589]